MKHLLQNYVVESLRKVIQQKGFRHEDVASQMDLSRQSISNYLTLRTEMSLNVFRIDTHPGGEFKTLPPVPDHGINGAFTCLRIFQKEIDVHGCNFS